ncbi:uncharacterized protein LOC129218413 [Uloborus diversus]|uniref:uncharacterized protein LOC129218413 n=1 Tax=Uloborus diversus TaxID=327109 RepID=UPI00240A0FB6|nr:uncharacterized protein LOC129218413 [Uloborus diversus]
MEWMDEEERKVIRSILDASNLPLITTDGTNQASGASTSRRSAPKEKPWKLPRLDERIDAREQNALIFAEVLRIWPSLYFDVIPDSLRYIFQKYTPEQIKALPDDCEIKQMLKLMKTRVEGSILHYVDLTQKHVCRLERILTSETINQILYAESALKIWPALTEAIHLKLRAVEKRRVLAKQFIDCMSLLASKLTIKTGSKLIPVPDTCWDDVLLCLKDEELQNFISAFQL